MESDLDHYGYYTLIDGMHLNDRGGMAAAALLLKWMNETGNKPSLSGQSVVAFFESIGRLMGINPCLIPSKISFMKRILVAWRAVFLRTALSISQSPGSIP